METPDIKIGTVERVLRFERVKSEVISAFQKEKIVGLDLNRAEDFIRSNGMEVKPYIIIGREDQDLLNRISGSSGLFRNVNFKEGVGGGIYIPEIDMVVVIRDPEKERLNGVIYTESILVHELAHASSMYRGFIKPFGKDVDAYMTPRSGYCLPNSNSEWGWFLEEGFAELLRGKYKSKYMNRLDKNKLERSFNYGELDWDDTLQTPDEDNIILPSPLKYADLRSNGVPGNKSSSYAAFALELILKRDPEIFPLLCEARKSLPSLRKLAKRLNKVSDGLYLYIQKGPYNMESFRSKLLYVINNISGGFKEAVKADGRLRDHWKQLGFNLD